MRIPPENLIVAFMLGWSACALLLIVLTVVSP